jgi:hypothetical protein
MKYEGATVGVETENARNQIAPSSNQTASSIDEIVDRAYVRGAFCLETVALSLGTISSGRERDSVSHETVALVEQIVAREKQTAASRARGASYISFAVTVSSQSGARCKREAARTTSTVTVCFDESTVSNHDLAVCLRNQRQSERASGAERVDQPRFRVGLERQRVEPVDGGRVTGRFFANDGRHDTDGYHAGHGSLGKGAGVE